MLEADAIVCPASSSMTWAYISDKLRKTLKRGRCSVPCTSFRTRACRRMRASERVFSAILLCCLSGLTSLASDLLALIMETFPMIWFRRPDITNIRCNLTDQFLVKTSHKNQARFRFHVKGNPCWRFHLYRM